MRVLAGIGASPGSLAGEHAPEPASSAAAVTWRGQVDVHVAQRVPRSRFVEQLEQEPDLDALGTTSAETSAAAEALAAAARQAVHLGLHPSPGAETPLLSAVSVLPPSLAIIKTSLLLTYSISSTHFSCF